MTDWAKAEGFSAKMQSILQLVSNANGHFDQIRYHNYSHFISKWECYLITPAKYWVRVFGLTPEDAQEQAWITYQGLPIDKLLPKTESKPDSKSNAKLTLSLSDLDL